MSKIPEVALETWKDLYAAAVQFAGRRLWERLEDSAIFGEETGTDLFFISHVIKIPYLLPNALSYCLYLTTS